MTDYMKKPCIHCPFRHDVTPFLTPIRGDELANSANNPYNDFPCHKTMEHDDEGETICVEKTKQCAGFLTLMASNLGEDRMPEGFKPSYDIVYSDSWEMSEAYEAAW